MMFLITTLHCSLLKSFYTTSPMHKMNWLLAGKDASSCPRYMYNSSTRARENHYAKGPLSNLFTLDKPFLIDLVERVDIMLGAYFLVDVARSNTKSSGDFESCSP